MTPHIIGLCGPEGAGKSMAAKLLKSHTRGEIHPFAGPLKSMIAALGVDPRHLYGTPADKAEPLAIFGGQTARHAMQTLGTEWGRACIGPNFWVNAWLATAPKSCTAVADDVRFENEARAIMHRGGVVIRVIRSLADLEREPKHASEDFRAVPFTVQVINDKCPTELQRALIRALQSVAA